MSKLLTHFSNKVNPVDVSISEGFEQFTTKIYIYLSFHVILYKNAKSGLLKNSVKLDFRKRLQETLLKD